MKPIVVYLLALAAAAIIAAVFLFVFYRQKKSARPGRRRPSAESLRPIQRTLIAAREEERKIQNERDDRVGRAASAGDLRQIEDAFYWQRLNNAYQTLMLLNDALGDAATAREWRDMHQAIHRVHTIEEEAPPQRRGEAETFFAFEPLRELEPFIQERHLENRRAEALENAATKTEAVEAFFNDGVTYTEDRQNVHESKIVQGALENWKRFEQMQNLQMTPNQSSAAAEDFVGRIGGARAADALAVLKNIEKGGLVLPFRETEGKIFAKVWNYAEDGDRKAGNSNLREAVVDAMASGVENGEPVCASGRMQRMLFSFAGLDGAEELSAPMTFEMYKNQIFGETGQILRAAIERAKTGTEDEQKVAASYEGGDEAPPAAEEAFKANVRREIQENVAKYDGQLSSHDSQVILSECFAGVDL